MGGKKSTTLIAAAHFWCEKSPSSLMPSVDASFVIDQSRSILGSRDVLKILATRLTDTSPPIEFEHLALLRKQGVVEMGHHLPLSFTDNRIGRLV